MMHKRNLFEENKSMLSVIPAFVLGGLIGAGIALLMAPQSGQETRNMIRNRSLELKDRAVETAEDTMTRAEKTVDDIASQTKDRVDSIRHRGKEMIEEQRGRLEDEVKAAKRSASY
jgi:gas vesicle protein